jgi:hypothetical protein
MSHPQSEEAACTGWAFRTLRLWSLGLEPMSGSGLSHRLDDAMLPPPTQCYLPQWARYDLVPSAPPLLTPHYRANVNSPTVQETASAEGIRTCTVYSFGSHGCGTPAFGGPFTTTARLSIVVEMNLKTTKR